MLISIRPRLTGLAIAAVVAIGPVMVTPAEAQPVYDTPVLGTLPLTGSRVLNVQQLETGGTTVITALTLSWNIGYTMGVTPWSYSYSMSWTPTGANAISHMILDLSDDCTAALNCVVDAKVNGSASNITAESYNPEGYTGADSSNPGMAGAIKGIKFDFKSDVAVTPFTLTFQSERAPVWGDFYTKAGNVDNAGWYSQNVGIDQHNSDNVMNFIARPNGATPSTCPDGTALPFCFNQGTEVPEPMSMALLGVGLLGLAGIRARRRGQV